MAVFKKMFKKFLGFEEEFDEDNLIMQNNQNTYFKEKGISLEKVEAKETRSTIKPLFEPEAKIYNESKEVLLYPKTFEDACEAVENLEKGNIVIINMEEIDIDTCKRISDFVLGAIFALHGDVEKLSKKTFRFWINK